MAQLKGGFGLQVRIVPGDLEEIYGYLNTFFGEIKTMKVQRKALAQAAQVGEDFAKSIAPKRTGQLRKSLSATYVKQYPQSFGVDIRAKRGPDSPGGYYAHLVEYGHRTYRTTRWRRVRLEDSPARKFMSRTFLSKQDEMAETYRRSMKESMDQLVAKAVRKTRRIGGK
jgi:HK97 gp10 family phage protein